MLPFFATPTEQRQREDGTLISVRIIAQAIVLVVGLCGAAHAEPEQPPSPPSAKCRAAAVAAALFPGALVHGSGHYVLGDKRAARRLLFAEAIGLGLLGAGGAVLGLSGTDENVAMLYVPLLISGAAVVAGSFLADLLGVSLTGTARAGAGARPDRPGGALGSVTLGYRHVAHPNLDVDHLVRASADVQAGKLYVSLATEVEARNHLRDYQLELAYQLPWRPMEATMALGFDGARRRLAVDDLASMPMALWSELFWDLGRRLPRLPGAYARARLGLGVEIVDYDAVPGRDDDIVPFVVGSFGLGFRLGRGELELDYDHRKDGFPGGVYLGRLPGFMGSVGISARLPLLRRFALVGAARYGTGATAWVGLQRGF